MAANTVNGGTGYDTVAGGDGSDVITQGSQGDTDIPRGGAGFGGLAWAVGTAVTGMAGEVIGMSAGGPSFLRIDLGGDGTGDAAIALPGTGGPQFADVLG